MYPPIAESEDLLWAVIADEARFAPMVHPLK
jgi:hypothetical protein